MNHLYDLNSFETVESLLEQIEADYLVSENARPMILKLLAEYFRLKENSEPSAQEKWSEISKILDTFDMKIKS
jgi:hypothetical protein